VKIRVYLQCSAGDLSFISGPAPLRGTTYSTELVECVEYSVTKVEQAILAHPGVEMSVLEGGSVVEDDADALLFAWRDEDRRIELEIADDRDSSWSGSPIEVSCAFSDLLELWRTITVTCPFVWLHDSDCCMFSPAAYLAEVVQPTLATEFASSDANVRDAAAQELERCRKIVGASQ